MQVHGNKMPTSMEARPTRQTRQKDAVLRSLAESGRSLAPAEILELARGEVPTLNLSTVYRQLRALHEEAQVVKVDLPGQASRFEAPCSHAQARGTAHKAPPSSLPLHGVRPRLPDPRLPGRHRAVSRRRASRSSSTS